MLVDNNKIIAGFDALRNALGYCNKFEKITGKKAGIRGFESIYGEYLIASKLIDNGFTVTKFGKKGVDITAEYKGKQITIEVKTSRKTSRFGGKSKCGYGFVIKKSQWKNKEYDYLACVFVDRENSNIAIFPYEETKKRFTKCSFTRNNTGQREEDSLRLDVYGSLDDLMYNLDLSKKEIDFAGKPSDFEKKVNENENILYEKFSFEHFIDKIKK